jgi:hypothetical protein
MSRFGNIFKNYRFTLNNRILLYFILILTIGDLMYFSLAGEMMFFFIYLAVGFLTSFFSKNMIVILVVAMTVTHVLRFGKTASRVSEGMDNQDDENQNKENQVTAGQEPIDPISAFAQMKAEYGGLDNNNNNNIEPFDPNMDETKLESAPANGKSTPTSSTPMGTVSKGPVSASPGPASAIDKLKESTKQIQQIKDKLQSARENDMATPIGSISYAPAPAPASSSLNNLMNTKIDSPLAINNSKPVVSGFENLDAQTKKLLNTQQELMSNMENLSPLLAQAEQFMKKFQGLAN